mmetsp:Transcript_9491/g.15546  ORF Transcript_9491/g.15546 Transcript_9491/m.15546 type:complete len:90 (+) Transcript_9491:312-581(+)
MNRVVRGTGLGLSRRFANLNKDVGATRVFCTSDNTVNRYERNTPIAVDRAQVQASEVGADAQENPTASIGTMFLRVYYAVRTANQGLIL